MRHALEPCTCQTFTAALWHSFQQCVLHIASNTLEHVCGVLFTTKGEMEV